METTYDGCKIIDIRRNPRTGNLLARLQLADGTIAVSATLDYIVRVLEERLSK